MLDLTASSSLASFGFWPDLFCSRSKVLDDVQCKRLMCAPCGPNVETGNHSMVATLPARLVGQGVPPDAVERCGVSLATVERYRAHEMLVATLGSLPVVTMVCDEAQRCSR
mmetsp:Transcript_110732/g.277271  ORF Transcript_110732/g.277271 Transcript_110732/m.277271 type:complete len:111 (-) Transcript_110732:8-340(-)